jgi:AraC-like DNA-binding protein
MPDTASPLPAVRARVRGKLYLFDYGMVYAGPWHSREFTSRFLAVVLVSADGRPFRVETDDQAIEVPALAIRPFVRRRLVSPEVPVISAGVSPLHACYRVFRELPESGVLPLERERFDPFDEKLQRAVAGGLQGREPAALAQSMCETLALQLPTVGPLDKRVQRVLDRLDIEPGTSLDVLAEEVGLSYDRLSHLFSDEMGLPLRSYALSQKIHRAASLVGRGLNLTEIALSAGFADSAHFSRVWSKAFGASPAAFFNSASVGLHNAITQLGSGGPLRV